MAGQGQQLTPSAMMRLQRDIAEMEKEELPGIEVRIDAADISKMCLLLTPLEGPYMGARLHLSVTIPPTYPHQPPVVSIQNPVYGHPNVFKSGYICCDILKPAGCLRTPHSYSGGYTPAYLLKYIFMQILSFFSCTWVEQQTLSIIDSVDKVVKLMVNSKLSALSAAVPPYSCVKCGFDSASSCSRYSACTATLDDEKKHTIAAPAGEPLHAVPDDNLFLSVPGEERLRMMPDKVWLLIFDRLSDQDLVSLGRASPWHAGAVLRRYNVRVRRELLCFFSRKTFQEAVLGVGIRQVARRGARRPDLCLEDFELLSLEAFQREHVRRGVRGHEFTHFLPLALDQPHFARAVPALHDFLASLRLDSSRSYGCYRTFLDVIPKLMNTMVVNMMKESDAAAGAMVVAFHESQQLQAHSSRITIPMPTHGAFSASLPALTTIPTSLPTPLTILQASENAFRGYCLLFHLLLKLAETDPGLTAEAERRFHLFFHNKKERNKKNIPDLGEFLAVLPLVLEDDFQWPALCSCIVEELLTRNVLWVLRAKPELASSSSIPARVRLEETFSASKIGLRLTMLQASFMRGLVQVRSNLSESYGFPPQAMAAELVELVKRIYSVGSRGRDASYGAWRDFFTLMQYEPIPDEAETERMLKLAVHESENKGYHHPHRLR